VIEIVLDGRSAPPAVTTLVSELSATIEPDAMDHASIVLANPLPELPLTHGDQHDTLREGRMLTIKLDDGAIFDGEITGVTARFGEDGPSTVTVEAYNLLHRLAQPRRVVTYENKTDAAIAREIAGRNGLQADVSGDVLHEVLVQRNEDDLTFLRARARAVGAELRVAGRTLRFKPPAVSAAPAATLAAGRPTPPGAIPLIDVETRLDARGPVTSVEVRGQDPLTRKPIVAKVGAASARRAAGPREQGAGSVADAVSGTNELTVVDRPVESAAEAQALAKAMLDELNEQLVVATGTVAGTPSLWAGSVVQIAGVGVRFSGPYYVDRTAHSWGSSGYRTSFSARRGAVGRG
jgi:uncharacterized protein